MSYFSRDKDATQKLGKSMHGDSRGLSLEMWLHLGPYFFSSKRIWFAWFPRRNTENMFCFSKLQLLFHVYVLCKTLGVSKSQWFSETSQLPFSAAIASQRLEIPLHSSTRKTPSQLKLNFSPGGKSSCKCGACPPNSEAHTAHPEILYTPLKINMERDHRGLEDHFPS